jgi:murein hydrolase activator
MVKSTAVLLGVIFPAIFVATAAAAVEGGWLRGLDALERAEVDAAEEADALLHRVVFLDEHLAQTLLDSHTAHRATRELRAEVAASHVSWDRALRQAKRSHLTAGSQQARAIERSLQLARPAVVAEDRHRFEQLTDVDRGVDRADHLLVVRGELSVEHALFRGHAARAGAERELWIELARDGQQAAQLAEEAEEVAEELSLRFEDLDRNSTAEDFHRRRGGLVPPVASAPDHLFGPRKQADSMTYIRHTGLTYLVGIGTEVRSVGAGVVVLADRLPGFGKLIIIDHGSYHSLYAHLSEFSVEAGTQVADRALLGLSGESGSLEGPKLYFELRRLGQPIDPEDWFIRRE